MTFILSRDVTMRALLVLTLLAVATPGLAQEMRIAAVVNDDVISIADLSARMRLIISSSNIEDSPQTQQRIGRQVLRNLIDEKLEMQEAKRLNIIVSSNEIAEAIGRNSRTACRK